MIRAGPSKGDSELRHYDVPEASGKREAGAAKH
jgi:hypothetical protein